MKISASRLNNVVRSMEAYMGGKTAQFDLFQCADYIGWLFKFKKLPKEELDFLVRWMTAIFEEDFEFLDEIETEYGQSWVKKLKSHQKL